VDVSEDGGDGATLVARSFGSPRARIEMFQQKLIHPIIQGISL
jgi:hypothetical protein